MSCNVIFPSIRTTLYVTYYSAFITYQVMNILLISLPVHSTHHRLTAFLLYLYGCPALIVGLSIGLYIILRYVCYHISRWRLRYNSWRGKWRADPALVAEIERRRIERAREQMADEMAKKAKEKAAKAIERARRKAKEHQAKKRAAVFAKMAAALPKPAATALPSSAPTNPVEATGSPHNALPPSPSVLAAPVRAAPIPSPTTTSSPGMVLPIPPPAVGRIPTVPSHISPSGAVFTALPLPGIIPWCGQHGADTSKAYNWWASRTLRPMSKETRNLVKDINALYKRSRPVSSKTGRSPSTKATGIPPPPPPPPPSPPPPPKPAAAHLRQVALAVQLDAQVSTLAVTSATELSPPTGVEGISTSLPTVAAPLAPAAASDIVDTPAASQVDAHDVAEPSIVFTTPVLPSTTDRSASPHVRGSGSPTSPAMQLDAQVVTPAVTPTKLSPPARAEGISTFLPTVAAPVAPAAASDIVDTPAASQVDSHDVAETLAASQVGGVDVAEAAACIVTSASLPTTPHSPSAHVRGSPATSRVVIPFNAIHADLAPQVGGDNITASAHTTTPIISVTVTELSSSVPSTPMKTAPGAPSAVVTTNIQTQVDVHHIPPLPPSPPHPPPPTTTPDAAHLLYVTRAAQVEAQSATPAVTAATELSRTAAKEGIFTSLQSVAAPASAGDITDSLAASQVDAHNFTESSAPPPSPLSTTERAASPRDSGSSTTAGGVIPVSVIHADLAPQVDAGSITASAYTTYPPNSATELSSPVLSTMLTTTPVAPTDVVPTDTPMQVDVHDISSLHVVFSPSAWAEDIVSPPSDAYTPPRSSVVHPDAASQVDVRHLDIPVQPALPAAPPKTFELESPLLATARLPEPPLVAKPMAVYKPSVSSLNAMTIPTHTHNVRPLVTVNGVGSAALADMSNSTSQSRPAAANPSSDVLSSGWTTELTASLPHLPTRADPTNLKPAIARQGVPTGKGQRRNAPSITRSAPAAVRPRLSEQLNHSYTSGYHETSITDFNLPPVDSSDSALPPALLRLLSQAPPPAPPPAAPRVPPSTAPSTSRAAPSKSKKGKNPRQGKSPQELLQEKLAREAKTAEDRRKCADNKATVARQWSMFGEASPGPGGGTGAQNNNTN